MSCRMCRISTSVLLGSILQAYGLSELPSPPLCFGGPPPGTMDRSSKTIKLAYRNWVSHDLATYTTQIILKEFLRYDVKLMDASSRSTSAWGPDMVAGDFDLDMEQWQISSTSFRDYVTRDQLVMNLGPIGYPGRGGIFMTNGATAAGIDPFADYYITFQDAKKALSVGLPKFGDINLRSLTSAEFPVCSSTKDWCGSGPLEGYWAPPACAKVASSPKDCVEVIMMRPSWDSGYFEELTTNLGLKLVHGYYGNAHNKLVKDMAASGKTALFYWYTPDPLVAGTSAARISFPDFFVGCANGDTRRPDGPVSCDYPEMSMLKLGHSRLKDKAEAIYFLQHMEILTADIEGMMKNHTSTNGPYDAAGAACAWVKSHMDKVSKFAPDCIVKPPATPKTGDFVFDKDKLECVQTTVYNRLPTPAQCLNSSDLGAKDRAGVTVKVGVRGWLSQGVGTTLAGLVLKDILRYNVEFVDLSPSSTSAWGPEISSGLFHFDSEQWQAAPDGPLYGKYVKEEKTVLDFGDTGYGGRGAMFTFSKTVNAHPEAGYYKYFQKSADAIAAGYPRYLDTPLRSWLGSTDFPLCKPEVMPWCPTGSFRGYWVPPQCASNPTDCVEFFMAYPTYDTAYFEQLTRNLGLKVIHGYYGSNLTSLVKERFAQNKPTVFYWWEPDPTPPQVGAIRLSYPDFSYGCDRSHNRNADTGGLACDYPETTVKKLGSAILKQIAPEAYHFLSNFVILKADMEAMMADHVQGGGPSNTVQAACNFLKANKKKMSAAFPDCIAYPKALNDIKIGDTTFDTDTFVCKAMTCPKDEILKVDGSRIFCQGCPDGLVPGADQTQCELCPKGTSVNENRTACSVCLAGHYTENRGQTACDPCPRGSFVGASGSTMCGLCDKGMWQDLLGSVSCKSCGSSKTTDSRGMFAEDSCQCPPDQYLGLDGICAACPEGMKCSFGSKVANIALYPADKSLPIPQVNPGYYTRSSEPMSVYLCSGTDTQTCPGGPPTTCGGGLQGLVCQECPDGQALLDGVCTKCDPGPSVLIFAVLPVTLCILALIMFKVGNDAVTVNVGVPLMVSVLLGLFVTTMQTLALFPGLSIEWRSQGNFFAGFKFFLGNPDAWAGGIRLGCALSAKPLGRYLFSCFQPLLCVLAVLVVWGVSLAVAKAGRREGWNINIMCNTLGQLLQTVFIAIAVLVVQPLRCYGHPNQKASMTSFPQILCWGEDDMHTSLVVIGIILGMLFVIPFLAVCVRAVVQAPKSVDPVGHYQRYRFLIYRFRADVWWWGIVFLLRQLALAFSCCIPADSPQWQITYVAMVTSLYLIVLCLKQPWKNTTLNYVDLCSMVVVNFIIISSSALVVKRSQDVQSFVVLHFCILAFFSVFVLFVFGRALYWAKVRGVRGDYGRQGEIGTISKAWVDFIKVSASIDPQVIMLCVKTFTEFDVKNLVQAMGSFQSVHDTFGARLAPRLKTISHSSKDVKGLSEAVQHSAQSASQDSSQENANGSRLPQTFQIVI